MAAALESQPERRAIHAAARWSESPECREIATHRLNGTKSNVVMLEGRVPRT
jgi:hypothetical protein